MSMASETNSARLSVRPAGDGDLGPLTAAVGPDVPATQVTRRLEESRLGYRDMLVAELDGQVVGTVSMGGHTAFRGRARCGCSRSALERLSAAGASGRP